MLTETDIAPHATMPPLPERVAESFGRSQAIAEALRTEGINFSYTPLDGGTYEGFYVLDHEPQETATDTEPTVRLYRGISTLDASVLHQVPYAAKVRNEDGSISATDDPVLLEGIARFLAEPSYQNLHSYVDRIRATADFNTDSRIAGRMRKLENRILDGWSLTEALHEAHGNSLGNHGFADISPYISTTPDVSIAPIYGTGGVLVLDVPISQLHDSGRKEDVLIAGGISPESVTAVAIKRSEYATYGMRGIVPLLPQPMHTTEDISEYFAGAEKEEASEADMATVSAVRSAELLATIPVTIRGAIELPEPGPHSYKQLQQSLFDFYMAAVPDLKGRLYRELHDDPDYKFDMHTDTIVRHAEPYKRDKVTNQMLESLLYEYSYEMRLRLRRASRVAEKVLHNSAN